MVPGIFVSLLYFLYIKHMKENIIEPRLFNFPEPAPVESANQNLHRAKGRKTMSFIQGLRTSQMRLPYMTESFLTEKGYIAHVTEKTVIFSSILRTILTGLD